MFGCGFLTRGGVFGIAADRRDSGAAAEHRAALESKDMRGQKIEATLLRGNRRGSDTVLAIAPST